MKDYIPDAPFNEKDQPVGDKRWWYQEFYKKERSIWPGPEPDKFSPHTREEEQTILRALLEGILTPRTDLEAQYTRLIGVPRLKSQWPAKWVTCKGCGSEWKCTGYPAGPQTKFTDSMATGAHELIDSSGIVWLFPKICLSCTDLREARPKKPAKKPVLPSKVRSPHNND